MAHSIALIVRQTHAMSEVGFCCTTTTLKILCINEEGTEEAATKRQRALLLMYVCASFFPLKLSAISGFFLWIYHKNSQRSSVFEILITKCRKVINYQQKEPMMTVEGRYSIWMVKKEKRRSLNAFLRTGCIYKMIHLPVFHVFCVNTAAMLPFERRSCLVCVYNNHKTAGQLADPSSQWRTSHGRS